jgi:hypothetical protein
MGCRSIHQGIEPPVLERIAIEPHRVQALTIERDEHVWSPVGVEVAEPDIAVQIPPEEAAAFGQGDLGTPEVARTVVQLHPVEIRPRPGVI